MIPCFSIFQCFLESLALEKRFGRRLRPYRSICLKEKNGANGQRLRGARQGDQWKTQWLVSRTSRALAHCMVKQKTASQKQSLNSVTYQHHIIRVISPSASAPKSCVLLSHMMQISMCSGGGNRTEGSTPYRGNTTLFRRTKLSKKNYVAR